MAKAPKIDARMARFVIEDLRRRRIPVDKLLKEVGLKKADLASPEGRIPYAPVIHLIERAAAVVGDPSYGLRLAASRDSHEHGLLGFLALNSPTLRDALINLQRYYRIAREEVSSRSNATALRWRSDLGRPIRRCADSGKIRTSSSPRWCAAAGI